MRLVICDGIQYDADNLPAHVDGKKCVPADQWFADNRVVATPAPKADDAGDEPKPKRRSAKARKSGE